MISGTKASRRDVRYRRIQIGAAGLAAIVLLLTIADFALQRRALSPNPVATSEEQNEPLAELGVQPVKSDGDVAPEAVGNAKPADPVTANPAPTPSNPASDQPGTP